MSRRVLSLLLALAMVLSMVPVVGSADTGDRASLSAQVEQTESQAVVRIDYRIPDRTFTAGKSYAIVGGSGSGKAADYTRRARDPRCGPEAGFTRPWAAGRRPARPSGTARRAVRARRSPAR